MPSTLGVSEHDLINTSLVRLDHVLALLVISLPVKDAEPHAALGSLGHQQVALVFPVEETQGVLALLDEVKNELIAAGVHHVVVIR